MTSYDPAIPQPADILADSQNDLLTNFTDLDTYLRVNHVSFSNADFGKHKFVTLTKNTPGLTTSSTEVGLFCKDDAAGNVQLYFRPRGTAAGSTASQKTPWPSVFAYCIFDNAGSIPAGQKYNVTSVTVNTAGTDYVVNFTNGLMSEMFFPSITVFVGGSAVKAPTVRTVTPTTMRILLDNTLSASSIQRVSVMIWGD